MTLKIGAEAPIKKKNHRSWSKGRCQTPSPHPCDHIQSFLIEFGPSSGAASNLGLTIVTLADFSDYDDDDDGDFFYNYNGQDFFIIIIFFFL